MAYNPYTCNACNISNISVFYTNPKLAYSAESHLSTNAP